MTDLPSSPGSRTESHARRIVMALAAGLVISLVLIAVIVIRWQSDRDDLHRDLRRSESDQATAERRTDQAQSLALAAYSQDVLAQGDTAAALALALEAIKLDPDAPEVQSNLAEAAYAPGIRRLIDLPDLYTSAGMAISPDARTIVCGSQQLILLDAETGQEVRRLEGEDKYIERVEISPDGQKALGATGSHYWVWNLQTGEIIARLADYTGEFANALFSPDSRSLLLWTIDGYPVLWDVETDHVIRHYELGQVRLGQAAFSPSGRRLLFSTAEVHDELILVDVATGDILRRLSGPQAHISALAFYADDTMFFSGGSDGSLSRWSLDTGEVTDTFEGATERIYRITISPDNWTMLTAGDRGDEVIWWNIPYAAPLRHFTGVEGIRIAFSPDGRRAVIGPTRQLNALVIDLYSGAEDYRLGGALNPMYHAAFSPDGRWIAAGSMGGELLVWDTATRQPRPFTGHSTEITGVAFGPEGDWLVSAGKDGRVIVWDVATGIEIRRLADDPSRWYVSLAVSPDGQRIATGLWADEIRVWDTSTGAVLSHLEHHSPAESLAFSPDGQTLLAASYDSLALWDLNTGQMIRSFADDLPDSSITAVSFSPDGQTFLATYRVPALAMWEVQTGRLLRRIDGIASAAFSPKGDRLGAITAAGDLILLDTSTWQAVRRWEVAGQSSVLLRFSPDGRRLMTNDASAGMILWRIDTLDELIDWVNYNRYVPDLTCEQQQRYRLDPFCDAAGSFPTRTPLPTQTIPPTADLARTTATSPVLATPTRLVPSLNAPSLTPSITPPGPLPTETAVPTLTPSPGLEEPPVLVQPTFTPSVTPPGAEPIIVEVSDVPGLVAAVETANASGGTTEIILGSEAATAAPPGGPEETPAPVTVEVSDVAGLIAAMNSANASGAPTTIRLKPGTYTLTDATDDTALPPVTGDITLDGLLAEIERVSDAEYFRLLRVESGGTLTLYGLTVRGGRLGETGDGAAIYNAGTLVLDNVEIVNNHARNGGGIYSDAGKIVISNATFSNNEAVGSGGGLFMLGGEVTIRDSQFRDNSAEIGGAIDNEGGTLTISSSRFTNNRGTGGAGGIHNTGTLDLRSSELSGSTIGN